MAIAIRHILVVVGARVAVIVGVGAIVIVGAELVAAEVARRHASRDRLLINGHGCVCAGASAASSAVNAVVAEAAIVIGLYDDLVAGY